MLHTANRAYKKFSEEGFSSMLQTGSRYMRNIPNKWLLRRLSTRFMSRNELLKYSQTHGRHWKFGEPESYVFSLPNGSDEQIWKNAFRVKSTACPETVDLNSDAGYSIEGHQPFVCEIPDVRIFGPYGIACTRDGRLLLEIVGDVERLFSSRLKKTFSQAGRIKTLRKIARGSKNACQHVNIGASFISTHGNCFSHWNTEDLPRLKTIREYEKRTGVRPTIIIGQDAPKWMLSMLRHFGYKEEDWIEYSGDMVVDRLVLPVYKPMRLFETKPNPVGYEWVSSHLRNAVNWEQHLGKFSERIFISREGSEYRQITNRDEVMNAISDRGFEVYQPENLSLAEQIALFRGAETIAGPMGGAFANIIHAKEARLIEILPPNHVHLTWFEIANAIGVSYDYLIGEPVSGPSKNEPPSDMGEFYSTRDEDIVVHPSALLNVIDSAIS